MRTSDPNAEIVLSFPPTSATAESHSVNVTPPPAIHPIGKLMSLLGSRTNAYPPESSIGAKICAAAGRDSTHSSATIAGRRIIPAIMARRADHPPVLPGPDDVRRGRRVRAGL